MKKKNIFLCLLVSSLLFTAGCKRYGCPSNPNLVDLAKEQKNKKPPKVKPGTTSLFSKDVVKKKGLRTR